MSFVMTDLADADLPTTPDEMFCFALYRAHHAVHRAYAPHLKALDLTYPQYITLTYLWVQDGLTVGQLMARLRMSTGTATPLLKRLEERGFVTRQRSAHDERQVMVHLTEAGRAVEAKAPEITGCMIGETGMPVAELEQLVEVLTRMARRFEGGK